MLALLRFALLTLGPAASGAAPPVSLPLPPAAKFKHDLSDLVKRAQTDPEFAGVQADIDALHARLYFKADAKERLAPHTQDPRIEAVSVPISARELGDIAEQFRSWLSARGFKGSIDGIDGRQSQVSVSVFDLDRVVSAAREDRIDRTYLQIRDAVPHYV